MMTTTKRTAPETPYAALQHAAELVGAWQFDVQAEAHRRKGRSPKTFRFAPTEGHRSLVDAMPAVLTGDLSVNDAMALLHYGESAHELEQARTWKATEHKRRAKAQAALMRGRS